MAKALGKGTVVTALDSLSPGAQDQPEQYGKVGKVPIPEGVSRKQLVRDVTMLAWPSLLELVLTQLTSLADQIMVGRIPGEMGIIGLAAVGLSYQPKFLLMAAVQALNVGATAVIARYRGQQNQEKANQVFRQALLFNFLLSIVLVVVGLFGAEWMVGFMGTNISPETLKSGTEYLRIQFMGLTPLCLTFTITAALRGIGNTRMPLIYNTIANGANLILNYILIYGKLGLPAMGVAGASLATILGQTVAFAVAAVFICRKKNRPYVYFSVKEPFHFDGAIMGNIIRIGIPAMIEQLLMRAGMIIFGRAVASLGDLKFATHQILMSVQSFSFMLGQAFATASTTMVGQSLGKRRFDMAVVYLRQTRDVGRIAAVVLAALVILLRRVVMGVFTPDAAVIAMGSEILFLIALSQPIQADQFIVSGGLRGAGDTKYNAFVTLVTVLGVRAMLAVLLINVFGLELWGAWIALVCDQVLRTVLSYLRFRSGVWKTINKKRFEKKE